MNGKVHPLYLDAKSRMEKEFGRKRREGTLSKAHDEHHVFAVSTYGGAAARGLANAQGYSDVAEWWGLLAEVGGLLHDYRRYNNEVEPHGPASAFYLREIRNQDFWKDLSDDEFNALYQAVKCHSESFPEIKKLFGEPIGAKEDILTSVIAHGVCIGDDLMEGSGFPVLKRRAFFVGKERMAEDITMFRYPIESYLAVLGETMIRLYKKNPIDQYPEWLKPFAEEWHAIQYEFYKGLLEYTGMNEPKAAEYMLAKKFPKFDETLRNKIKQEQHLSGKHFDNTSYPVLSEKIQALNHLQEGERLDLAQSSYELVRLFSTFENPEQAINFYMIDPCEGELTYFDNFMKGITDYTNLSEKYVQTFEKRLTSDITNFISKLK